MPGGASAVRPEFEHEPEGFLEGVRIAVRDLSAKILRRPSDEGEADVSSRNREPEHFEPRGYSVTVDARPYEGIDGRWLIGDVTVRVCFYCSTSTHLLQWPDECAFDSALEASRAAYEEAHRWAERRYG